MNFALLSEHIDLYVQYLQQNQTNAQNELLERKERRDYYQSWTKDHLLAMTEDQFLEYVIKLWDTSKWYSKKYRVDRLIKDYGFDVIKKELSTLVWGEDSLDNRWDRFRKNVKGMGVTMMSEILCHVHPETCVLWNSRTSEGLDYLGVDNLPSYEFQMTGKRYVEISTITKEIALELQKKGVESPDLLTVDYFFWGVEVQVKARARARARVRQKIKAKGKTMPKDKKQGEESVSTLEEIKPSDQKEGQKRVFVTPGDLKEIKGCLHILFAFLALFAILAGPFLYVVSTGGGFFAVIGALTVSVGIIYYFGRW